MGSARQAAARRGRRGAAAGAVALSVSMLAGAMTTLGPSAHAADVAMAEDVVLDLRFDEDLTDASDFAAPVTVLRGTERYTDGLSGQAFDFDGATALSLGTGAHLQPTDLTLSFWFRPDGAMGSDEQLITWNKTAYNSDGWYLSSENASTPLTLSIGPASGQPYKVNVNGDRAAFFPADQWTHVVVIYDSQTKDVVFYRNGIRQTSTVHYPYGGDATGVLGSEGTSVKSIGYNGPQYNGSFLRGALDDYLLYDAVATAEDVVALYQEHVPAFDPAAVAQADLSSLVVPETAISSFLVATTGSQGSAITWASDSEHIAIQDGTAVVTRPDGAEPLLVTLTASATYAGSEPMTRSFEVTVLPTSDPEESIYLDDAGLEAVLLHDPYLVNANERMVDYLLTLEPERFLYGFYVQAGLEPLTDSGYGGWERTSGTRFQGHFFGHYVSALSQIYASTGDATVRDAALAKLTVAVDGLQETQAAYAQLDPLNAGYVSPFSVSLLPHGGDGLLVPFYNLHKVLAGLLDAYEYAPAEIGDVALEVADGFGTFIHDWAARQSNPGTILNTEYGGMNEALYELFSITTDPVHKRAAEYFDEVELFRALADGTDVLAGLHANTTIPKFIGAMKRYVVFTDNPDLYATLTETEKAELDIYRRAAENFWQIVIDDHTYANGGNSQSEHFHLHDTLHEHATNGVTTGYGENSTAEGCNVYNMLKLTRLLFQVSQDVKYADYYEHAYINSVLASQNPETGMMTYFQPMTSGYAKVFGRPYDEFWCDHGTAIESFTKLGDSFYFTDDGSIFVNQFRSSQFTAAGHGLVLTQVADVPNHDTVTLRVAAIEGESVAAGTVLRLRVPSWVAAEPTLVVNDVSLDLAALAADTAVDQVPGYVSFVVADGDEISYTVPAEVAVIDNTENPNWVAFSYGPLLLAAELNRDDVDATYVAGVLVRMSVADTSVIYDILVDEAQAWKAGIGSNLERIENRTDGNGHERLQFRLQNVDDAAAGLVFEPYYSLYEARYAIYLMLIEPDSAEAQEHILRRKEQLRIEETTIDSLVSFDNNNSEADKNHRYNLSSVGTFRGETFRHGEPDAAAYFQYDMIVDPSLEQNFLGVRYYGGDNGRTFDVYLNDVLLKTEVVTNAHGSQEWYVQYDEIPREILDSLDEQDSYKRDQNGEYILDEDGNRLPIVTVRFQGTGQSYVGGVFGLYTTRTDSYDTDAELSSLAFSAGELAPELTTGIREYTLTVPAGTESVELDVDPAVPSGLVYLGDILIDDALARTVVLDPDDATVVILRSYAQDHETSVVYRITVVHGDEPATPDPESVTIEPAPVPSLRVGDSLTLTATVLPAGAEQSVLWSVSDDSVATISADGHVTAVAPGTVEVTATSTADEAVSASVVLTVGLSELSGTTPAISGQAVVGARLTADPGAWTPEPVTLSYQWYRDVGDPAGDVATLAIHPEGADPIEGATQSSYLVTEADEGHRLLVVVTGTRDGYEPLALPSALTAVVLASDPGEEPTTEPPTQEPTTEPPTQGPTDGGTTQQPTASSPVPSGGADPGDGLGATGAGASAVIATLAAALLAAGLWLRRLRCAGGVGS